MACESLARKFETVDGGEGKGSRMSRKSDGSGEKVEGSIREFYALGRLALIGMGDTPRRISLR